MQIIEHKITAIRQLYDQLKQFENALDRKQQAQHLICLCEQTLDIIQKGIKSSKMFRYKTQIQRIKDTAIQELKDCDDQLNNRKRKFDVSRDSFIVESTEQTSKKIMRTILERQIQSKELRISGSEFEKIAKRLENNNHVMQQIYELVEGNGKNLEVVQHRLSVIYEATEETNEELDEALKLQMEAIVIDLRLGLTGILAAIGYGVLGLPGLIVSGVFGLYKTFI